MTVRYKYGYSTGSGSSPQLDCTVWDDAGTAIDRTTAFNTAVNNAPATLYGQPINGVGSIEELSQSQYKFSISYASPSAGSSLVNSSPTPPETGTLVRRGQGEAKTVRLKKFLSAGKVYNIEGAATDITTDMPYLKWEIDSFLIPNVGYLPQLHDFDPYPETRTLDYYVPNATLTDAYLDDLEEILGHFNSATLFGRAIDTVQFVRYSVTQRNDDDFELSLGFALVPTKTVSLTDAASITVKGTEYYWERQYIKYDGSLNEIEWNPWQVIRGVVWPSSDLATVLDLP